MFPISPMRHPLFTVLISSSLLLYACSGQYKASVLPDGGAEQAPAVTTNAVAVTVPPPAPALIVPSAIREGDTVTIAGMSVGGRYLKIDDELVMIFEYKNERDAKADQAKVSQNGKMIGQRVIIWNAPVHFFRHGQVIVIYLGNTSSLLKKLSDGGRQFAGT